MRHSRICIYSQYVMSQHAYVRSDQRGIKHSARDIVFCYGDREEPAGSGCYRLMISKEELRALVAEKIITARQAERCRRLTIVTDGHSIITNYKNKKIN
jgi:hypothetical protein